MLGQAIEPLRLVEVQLLVFDPLRERAPRRLVERQHAAVFLEPAPDLGAERVAVVRAPADGEDHELVWEEIGPPQLVEGRQDLAMGEVSGRPEQREDARIGTRSSRSPSRRTFSSWRGTALRRAACASRTSRIVLGASFGRGAGWTGLSGSSVVRRRRITVSATTVYPVFTACPPNSFRRAARTLAPYESSRASGSASAATA